MRKTPIRLSSFVLVLALLGGAPPAPAAQHLIDINEVYSNPDGSVQYVELIALFGFQSVLAPTSIRAFNADGTVENIVFDFTSSYAPYASAGSAGLTLLVATPDFESVFGFAPDFIAPPGSLFSPDGRVVFFKESGGCVGIPDCEIDAVSYGDYTGFTGAYGDPAVALPADGCLSLTRVASTNTSSLAFQLMPPTPTRTDGTTGSLPPCPPTPGGDFRRGDCNGDGNLDIADAVFHLAELFAMGTPATCDDACDSNDDGAEDISDPVYSLGNLFSMGPTPPPPGPSTCGSDPTDDSLDCAAYVGC